MPLFICMKVLEDKKAEPHNSSQHTDPNPGLHAGRIEAQPDLMLSGSQPCARKGGIDGDQISLFTVHEKRHSLLHGNGSNEPGILVCRSAAGENFVFLCIQ